MRFYTFISLTRAVLFLEQTDAARAVDVKRPILESTERFRDLVLMAAV